MRIWHLLLCPSSMCLCMHHLSRHCSRVTVSLPFSAVLLLEMETYTGQMVTSWSLVYAYPAVNRRLFCSFPLLCVYLSLPCRCRERAEKKERGEERDMVGYLTKLLSLEIYAKSIVQAFSSSFS